MTQFNPETTALIVVDMQNDFVHEDGALYAPPSEQAIDPVHKLIMKTFGTGAKIIYTKDVHPPDQFEDVNYYDEFDRWGEHVVEGSWGAEINEWLNPDKYADYIVEKQTYSAFHETDLDAWLTEHGITDLLICGTLANVCVLHTASGAALHDYKPVIVEDAVGYLDESDRDYAIEHANWLFGETTTLENVEFSE